MISVATMVDRLVQHVTRLPIRGRGRLASIMALLAPQVTIDLVGVGRVKWRMILDKQEFIQYQIHYFGWEVNESMLLGRALQPGMIFFDVGANVGYFSLLAAAIVGNQGRVFSFEPVSRTREMLMRNVKLNGFNNVELLPFALADHNGSREIFYYPGQDCGSNSFGRYSTDAGKETVECITWDRFMEERGVGNVDIAKIDVEGAELKVLRGAMHVLSQRSAPDLLIEINPERLAANGDTPKKVIDLLTDLGYRVFAIGKAGVLKPFELAFADHVLNIFATKKDVI